MLYALLVCSTILFIISKITVWLLEKNNSLLEKSISVTDNKLPIISEEQKIKESLFEFIYEVNNGGFNQLFRNLIGRDNDDLDTLYNSIQIFGNKHLIQLFEEAIKIFTDNQEQLINLRFNSEDPVKGFSESYNLRLFGKLDQEFYNLDKNDAILNELENRTIKN